jgi:hypothetical protein
MERIRPKLLQMVKIEQEQAQLREALIVQVLGQCSTLNQAIKLWPSILDFVPPDARERFREKNTRAKKNAELAQIEISDDAKHLLAKSRMLSGG